MERYGSQEQYNGMRGGIIYPGSTVAELQESVSQGFNKFFGNMSWPRWFEINRLDSVVNQVFWEKANHLEVPSEYLARIKNGEFSPLSLVRICCEDEGSKAGQSFEYAMCRNGLFGFLVKNNYDMEINDAVECLFNPKFSHIEIYPHRLQNEKDFRAILAHEMTHFFLHIKLLLRASKKGIAVYDFAKKYVLSDAEALHRYLFIHEAAARREGAHSLANIDSAYGVRHHSGKEYFDAGENSNYANGAKMGYLMHTMQNKIWNQMNLGLVKKYCQENGIEYSQTTDYQQFNNWCIKIQDYLEESLFNDRYLQRLESLLEYYHQQNDLMPFVEWGQTRQF